MPRPIKNEKKLKLKALRVAIILLRRKCEITNYISVRKKANEIGYPKYFTTEISKGTVEKPTTKEYQDIKAKIKEYKNENKIVKKIATISSKKKIKNLEIKVNDLTFKIASLLENEREMKELLESREKTLEKMRLEINSHIARIG